MLNGIITPTITIFDQEENIDFEALEKHIENLIQGGVNGILFLGSIGEFFAMTTAEKKKLISFAVDKVYQRVKVLVGTGGTAAEEVVELSNYAAQLGVDGVAVITPYFFQFNQETLFAYYDQLAPAINTDIYLYNFPARSGVSLTAEVVYQLAQKHDNIAGIKDTVDSISHTRELIGEVKNKLDRDFAVFSGFDEYFLPNLLNGGNGLIGGLSNVVPALFAEFFQSYQKGDFNRIKEISAEINRLMGIYSVSDPFFPAIKKATALKNDEFNAACKSPVKNLESEQIEKLKQILEI